MDSVETVILMSKFVQINAFDCLTIQTIQTVNMQLIYFIIHFYVWLPTDKHMLCSGMFY